MTSISTGGNTVSSFAYDAEGRRFSRTNGGTTTRFLYGPGGILLEKQGSTYTATYTHGNALIRKDSEYPLFDGIGSERTVTAANQSVAGTVTFEGFGQTIATTGSSGNPYMFAATSGYRNDGDAGLMHVGARYYDPQVGRFITRDTELDQHAYLYCEHEPITHVDSDGHWPEWLTPGRIWRGIVVVGTVITGAGVYGNVHTAITHANEHSHMVSMMDDWIKGHSTAPGAPGPSDPTEAAIKIKMIIDGNYGGYIQSLNNGTGGAVRVIYPYGQLAPK